MPSDNRQAIVVKPLNASNARVTAFEFHDGRWYAVFWPMRATVGRRGVAPLNEKREGDGRTPSGIYDIGVAFGYAKTIPTQLVYHQTTDQDFWVDDVNSPEYNQWVKGTPKAASFELMKRKDDLYRYGAVIEYNTHPIVSGNGSAIFMHIWRGPGKPTSGCVAFSPRSLKHVLQWLNASQKPVIVILN